MDHPGDDNVDDAAPQAPIEAPLETAGLPPRARPNLSTRTAVALSFSALMLSLIVMLYVMHLTRNMPRDSGGADGGGGADGTAVADNASGNGNEARAELVTALHLLRARVATLESEATTLRERVTELEANDAVAGNATGDAQAVERARIDRLLRLHQAFRGPDVVRQEVVAEYERLRAMDVIALESAAGDLIAEIERALAADARPSATVRCEQLVLLVRGHAIATEVEHAELSTRVDQLLMRLAGE